MEELFVIGDVHGERQKLRTLLRKWNVDRQQLVFTGDLIDRGADSFGVASDVNKLQKEYGCVALEGNHEGMFLDWIDKPEDEWFLHWVEDESIVNTHVEVQMSSSVHYYQNGGANTVNSFYGANKAYVGKPSDHVKYITTKHADLVDFIRKMPLYYEWQNFVCVHAGVDLNLRDWKNTSAMDMKWIRELFHWGRNETGKIFVFGHHPTKYLNPNGAHDVWISKCGTKIGIDGGAAYGGVLHGLVIKSGEIECHSVVSDETIVFNTLASF